jgi:hypothetical protein
MNTKIAARSQQDSAAQLTFGPQDSTLARADVCTDMNFSPDCPFCWGPETD